MVKKITNFSILMSAIFIYLIYMTKLQGHDINMTIIIGYLIAIIRVVLGICSIILTCNTMKMKINNRANFMSVCALSISVLSILQLWVYIKHSNSIYLMGINRKCKWLIEYLQIISLMICINYIDEGNSIKVWRRIYAAIYELGILFVLSPYGMTFKILNDSKGITTGEIISISCMILVSITYIMSYKKIKAFSPFERKIINALFGIKIILNALVGFHIVHYHFCIYAIYYIAQTIFSLLIIIYIDELTLSITWKKIDLGVKNKNEEAIRGYIEQRTLVTAASEIQRLIEGINRKTFNLEMKIEENSNSKYMKYIDKIKHNCHRLLKLSMNIQDLNTYERGKQTSRFELVNLTELLGSVVELLETYIMQRGIQIIYTASNECIMAEVDKEAIERLFLNLLSNAVKYNRSNGTIKVILTEKKKRVYLCIQDTGIGIPSHYLDLIFEKFQRVNAGLAREQEGSGLGLSIVKSLVDAHHGEIKIVSKEDRGTLISIGLPITQGEKLDKRKYKKKHKNSLSEKIQVEFSDLDK